jgi:hypothetical protein
MIKKGCVNEDRTAFLFMNRQHLAKAFGIQ